MTPDLEKLASGLSDVQCHIIDRCSDAESWDRSGNGMWRSWPDVISGYRGSSHRSINALVRKGILQQRDDDADVRLTALGLSVQYHVRLRAYLIGGAG